MLFMADGPHISKGPKQKYVLSGEATSLVCGYNLESNPEAVVTWTDPNGRQLLQSDGRYTLDAGPEIVRLNISEASEADNGSWSCSVAGGSSSTSIKFNVSLEVLGKQEIIAIWYNNM